MIDFTDCQRLMRGYGGANGKKISVLYHDEVYMLKFPAEAKLNPNIKYANSCVSEYIACHIFNSVGIQAQDTLLGLFTTKNGQTKEVVACKDFSDPSHGVILQDFASLKNQVIDTERHGYGTDLNLILSTIESQTIMDPLMLKDYFWDVFVVDEFIGNPDRHNGNWGFLYDSVHDSLTLAPIYDCGSSLLPQAGEIELTKMLNNKQELNRRIYEYPTSAIMLNDKRINYASFNQNHIKDYPDYAKALLRIAPKINVIEIGRIIDSVPGLSTQQAEFYKTYLSERKIALINHAIDLSLNYYKPGHEIIVDDRKIPGSHDYTTASISNNHTNEIHERDMQATHDQFLR